MATVQDIVDAALDPKLKVGSGITFYFDVTDPKQAAIPTHAHFQISRSHPNLSAELAVSRGGNSTLTITRKW